MRASLRISVSAPVALGLGLTLALPLSVACRANTPPPNTDPGETFVITGALTSNACAPGLDPINPLVFAASLRREGTLGYWRIGEQPWVPGTLNRAGEFHFTVSTDVEVYPPTAGTDPEFDPPRAGCVVSMVESIDGRVTDAVRDAGVGDASSDAQDLDASDAGPSAAATLEATNRIEIVPHAGSDCSRALLSAGGSFPTLPCAAVYSLEGER